MMRTRVQGGKRVLRRFGLVLCRYLQRSAAMRDRVDLCQSIRSTANDFGRHSPVGIGIGNTVNPGLDFKVFHAALVGDGTVRGRSMSAGRNRLVRISSISREFLGVFLGTGRSPTSSIPRAWVPGLKEIRSETRVVPERMAKKTALQVCNFDSRRTKSGFARADSAGRPRPGVCGGGQVCVTLVGWQSDALW